MLKKLMPFVLLLVGTGAGVGAGIFMRPAPAEMASLEGDKSASDKSADNKGSEEPNNAHSAKVLAKSDKDHANDKVEDADGLEYVKLNNQFVVPIVKDKVVKALVVMALSLEVPASAKDEVYRREPRVRDSILQVLFDHANIGGFDGAFTEARMLDTLRRALREVAQRDLGTDVVHDVLILEIARQDY